MAQSPSYGLLARQTRRVKYLWGADMHSHCGKVPYPNPVTAWRVLRSLRQPLALMSHKNRCQRRQIYRCPNGQAWHLASRLPRQRLPGQARREGRP
ncbi:MAG: hypothetical protein QG599_2989 [Pseudomonadota bacterium]|nr:hypothetical protein [Pseudomonadota bacterium]